MRASPIRIKISQNTQPTNERTKVRRSEKIWSRLRSSWVIIKSAAIVKAKSEMPKRKEPINPFLEVTKNVEKPIIMHMAATAKRAFLNDGRENMEE